MNSKLIPSPYPVKRYGGFTLSLTSEAGFLAVTGRKRVQV